MRIAICMSGQLRQWEYGKENQKWFWSSFNQEEYEVDYFIHTWDYSQDRAGARQDYETREITTKEYEEVIKWYGPKRALIESKQPKDFLGIDHWSCLFYSLGQSLLLKQEYELENNFKYDLVIKTRPDLVFSPEYHAHIEWNMLEDGQITTTHGGIMPTEFHNINFNDCVFYGNSYTMDLLINMLPYRQKMINHKVTDNIWVHPIGPGVLMHDFFREFGITPYFGTRWLETILKEGVPKVDLFNQEEFNQVEKYFRDWYHQ